MSKVEAVNNLKVIAVVGEKDAPVFVKESKNYSKVIKDNYLFIYYNFIKEDIYS